VKSATGEICAEMNKRRP